jgi:hypothetical protein
VVRIAPNENGGYVILISDFLRQLTTFQIPGATSERQPIEALARFGRMFMGALWDVCAAKHLLM